MRWKKKKPLWPVLIPMGCLFVLALSAPTNWRARDIDDSATADHASAVPVKVPSLENLQVVPRSFDFDTLLRMRDEWCDIVDQLPSQAVGVANRQAAAPRVRVIDSDDRLAMLSGQRSRVSISVSPFQEVADLTKHDVLAESLLKTACRGDAQTTQEPPTVVQSSVSDYSAPSGRLAERELTEPVPVAQEQSPLPPDPTLPLLRHKPRILIDQLESIAAVDADSWNKQLLTEIERLTGESLTTLLEVPGILDQISQHLTAGRVQATDITDPTAQFVVMQAVESVERRLPIWRALLDPTQSEPETENAASTPISDTVADDALVEVLTKLFTLFSEDPNGESWREYLLLDQIAAASSEGASYDVKGRGNLAQTALARLESPRLNEEQSQFASSAPLAALHQALRPWATGAINFDTLTAIMERYEQGHETRYAAAMGKLEQRLRWSANPRHQALANHLEQHYRGANMRIAITGELLNRMLPEQKAIVSPVRESIAGAKVRGRARTTTDVKVRLVPDPLSWNFALEASGKVFSHTRSETWPARTRNSAKLSYHARKSIEIDDDGLRISPAHASAQGRNELVDVESELDPIPILGFLLRNAARQKHKRSLSLAMSQVKSKVARLARQRMNSQADAKLKGLEEKFRSRVLTPFEQLSVLAETTSMATTSERAVMQLRLANPGQLAAHTPRPAAPSDSLASAQMHQTVLNNAAAGLGLEGKRMKMIELYYFLAGKLGFEEMTPPADMPARATIEFAPHDAARVLCDGDRLELVLNIREVARGRDKIQNFQVHATFRPKIDRLDVRLVREGVLHFKGRRLKAGPRVVLHSVFGKLLRKGQEVVLIQAGSVKDPRLTGLMITQVVIDHGWIAVAIGPEYANRMAWRSLGTDNWESQLVR